MFALLGENWAGTGGPAIAGITPMEIAINVPIDCLHEESSKQSIYIQ
jgi:hypothetical protein